ncbi:MAG: Chromatin structure remodeling complex protein sfh1 [Alyxoria varia]|nr:MAG: Chromatin structure remodeling complex protein sfh1 [Alyxoria varia]
MSSREAPPQAFATSYAPRIRTYANPLLTPVVEKPTQLPPTRTTKRGTTAINYAEDGYDDEDFYEDGEGPRRPTGLRSLRREEFTTTEKKPLSKDLGKEIYEPVDVQVIWREWISKPRRAIPEKQSQVQAALPLNLIPIRIDVDIPSFRPDPALPPPSNVRIDESLEAYRHPEPTPTYRLKDTFLWNLHEALIPPDQFARTFVDELDLQPNSKNALVIEIARQIREQLEKQAEIALHPLFSTGTDNPFLNTNSTATNNGTTRSNPLTASQSQSQAQTPAPTNGFKPSTATRNTAQVTATTLAPPSRPHDQEKASNESSIHNPDDTYRCIIHLSVNLLNRLYTDQFEWSLLHPPGLAEHFARQTCADLGLPGEWAAAIAHAIYDSVLKFKRDVCENQGQLLLYGELDNDAAPTSIDAGLVNGATVDGAPPPNAEAGWRYDPEYLADNWQPRVEVLSKEEIEKREADRERQLRRAKRETARFSGAANTMRGGVGPRESDYFAGGLGPTGEATPAGALDQPMGRGERSKKRKRYRSLSPPDRDSPGVGASSTQRESGEAGGTSSIGAPVPVGNLTDPERARFRCRHCGLYGSAVWGARDGPEGSRSLCQNCGFFWEKGRRLPPWSKGMFTDERPQGYGGGGYAGNGAMGMGMGYAGSPSASGLRGAGGAGAGTGMGVGAGVQGQLSGIRTANTAFGVSGTPNVGSPSLVRAGAAGGGANAGYGAGLYANRTR